MKKTSTKGSAGAGAKAVSKRAGKDEKLATRRKRAKAGDEEDEELSRKSKPTGDDRFSGFTTDPRFRSAKFSDKSAGKKVVVDKRFKAMFEDDEFKASKAKVDKYGRKIDTTKADDFTDMSRHYVLNEEDEARLERLNRVARGEIDASSSSSSEDEDEEEVEEEESSEELIPVEMGTDSTRRIAIVGCDWDHIRAMDLLAVLRSFAPSTGAVLDVAVYSSEFGREKMAREELDGPFAAQNQNNTENGDDDFNEDDDDDEVVGKEAGSGYDPELLRKYEKERFLYYFAVATCDSAETADTLYRECDGIEFEHSSVGLDLRFIPDDLKFDPSTMRDSASEIPDTYTPIDFVSKPMQQTTVQLSWDEPEYDRKKLQQWKGFDEKKAKKKGEKGVPLDELEAFIASEDEFEDSEEEEETRKQDVNRYRELLAKSTATEEDYGEAESDLDDDEPRKAKKDEFFIDEDEEKGAKPVSKKQAKQKQKKSSLLVEEDQLAGLVPEKPSKKELKKKKKKMAEEAEADVDMDVHDERFASLFTDSEFAFDRTDPKFKQTKTTRKIEEERRKRMAERIGL